MQKATDVGAVGSEDYAKKVGDWGRAQPNLARDFKMIATKKVDFFTEHYIAKIPLGQGFGH